MAAYLRMPTLAEMPPAVWDLAYLVDAAGGLEDAARLVDVEPERLAACMAGEPTALTAVAMNRLVYRLSDQLGWSFWADKPAALRAVA